MICCLGSQPLRHCIEKSFTHTSTLLCILSFLDNLFDFLLLIIVLVTYRKFYVILPYTIVCVIYYFKYDIASCCSHIYANSTGIRYVPVPKLFNAL